MRSLESLESLNFTLQLGKEMVWQTNLTPSSSEIEGPRFNLISWTSLGSTQLQQQRLFQILSQLDELSAADIQALPKVNGHELRSLPVSVQKRVRLEIQCVGECIGLLANRTLRDNLLLPFRYHRPEQIQAAALWIDGLRDSLAQWGTFSEKSGANALDLRPFDVTEAQRRLALGFRAVALQPLWLFVESADYYSDRQVLQMIDAYLALKKHLEAIRSDSKKSAMNFVLDQNLYNQIQSDTVFWSQRKAVV